MAEVFDFGLQQHKIKMDGKFFENNLFAVAGDTGRRLEVQLLDSNNLVQNTTGISLRLNADVAGQATYAEATLVDATKGLYELDLPNGMLIAPGNWQFQWQIIGNNGEKLHSFAFTGSIGSNLSDGGTEATNFYLNADELKQMQDDLINGTFNSEVLETNIAEKLTDLETQYAPKLTKVTAQLTQIAINVSDFGAVGDGVTDDTLAIQNALDYATTNHLTVKNDYDKTYIVTGLKIENKQKFEIDFKGYLKTKDNVEIKKHILSIDNCSDYTITNYRGDGNSLQNGVRHNTSIADYEPNQHFHILNLVNSSKANFGVIKGVNPLGDVLSISGNINSNELHFDHVYGKSDEGIGRQTVSIVSGKNLTFNVIENFNIGHYSMPGGLDIEPYSTQTIVENVYVGYLHVETYGFSGLGVLSLQDTLKNVRIDNAKIINLNTVGTYTREAIFLGCKDVVVNNLHVICNHPSSAYGIAIGEVPGTPIPKVEDLIINNLVVENSRYGIIVDNAVDVKIKHATFKNCQQYFINMYGVDGFEIDLTGNIKESIHSSGGILVQGLYNQKNVTISGNLSKEIVGDVDTFAIMNNQIANKATNFQLKDLNLSGWEPTKMLHQTLRNLDKINCKGLTTIDSEVSPSPAYYKTGDFVRVLNPTDVKRIIGYLLVPNGFVPLSTI